MDIRRSARQALERIFIVMTACLLAASASAYPMPHGATYYVDCQAGQNDGDGRSVASAWNSLQKVNRHTFSAGDVLRFHRGTDCLGTLHPQGSGSADAPIRLTAYGEGERPKVTAGSAAEESFALYQQEYWDVDSLEFSGGRLYGIYISGRSGVLHHIHLINLVVHDVGGAEMKSKDNGLVLITPGTIDQHFDDVLIDGVVAYNAQQWMGILVGGGNFGFSPESTWSTHVIVRNSTVHDVQGDGIVLFRVKGGQIDSSVAWNTGMQITESIGTPNAIWTWMCKDCEVSNSEAFLTDSPGVDGGAFDIDYGNTNNSVVSNYGHDTQGYCVSIFGAGGVTRQSTVRGNVCVNNGRSPRMAQYQGAIFIHTWNGGTLDGVTIAENAVYWNPPGLAPMLINDASFHGGAAVFRDNTVYSSSPWLLASNNSLMFEANHYIYAGTASPYWTYDGKKYAQLFSYQNEASQDRESDLVTEPSPPGDPLFPSAGIIHPSSLASASGSAVPDSGPMRKLQKTSRQHSTWQLYCSVSDELDPHGLLNETSRRQLVVIKSLYSQFRSKGLNVHIVFPEHSGAFSQDPGEWQNVVRDLGLEGMSIDKATAPPSVVLFAPDDRIAAQWQTFAGPAQLGLFLRQQLGAPLYSEMGPSRR